MCHPAWGPAHAPAPYPRELERVRRLRDLIDRESAAHDGAGQAPLDVAALASRAGVPAEGLEVEFRLAYGVSLPDYIAAHWVRSPVNSP